MSVVNVGIAYQTVKRYKPFSVVRFAVVDLRRFAGSH